MAEASSTEDVITLRIRFKSDTFEKFAERYAADLTRDEIFIRTREPLPVGTPLAFDFSLSDATPLIAGRGAVGWTRDADLSHGAPAGMGIRFEALTDHSHEMLGRILEFKSRAAGGWNAPPTAAPERREPARPAAAPAGKAAASPKGSAPVAAATPSKASGAFPKQPPAQAGTPPNQAAWPQPPASASPPARPDRNVFPDEDDQEPTELAHLPPTFFYEGGEQEKTKLQDPRLNAALLQRKLTDDEDDDVTNVRATASMYNRPPASPAETPDPFRDFDSARAPRRTPPSQPAYPSPMETTARRPPPGQETPFRLPAPPPLTEHQPDVQPHGQPLVVSTTTEPLPADPGLAWRPVSPPPGQSQPTAKSSLERELFAGLQAGAGPGEPRWGQGPNIETMSTTPALPAVTPLDTDDPNVIGTPAWPAAVDPGAHMRVRQAQRGSDEEPSKRPLASLKMWVALTLAAGGIVVAALLLLPTLLRPSPQVGEMSPPLPEATPGAPAPANVPPSSPPAAPARAAAPENQAAVPPPGETAEAAKAPPPAAAAAPAPTEGAPPPGSAAPPAAAAESPPQPPAATPPAPSRPAVAEMRDRPSIRSVRPRGSRRSSAADRAATPGEIDADPIPPIGAPAGVQGDGNQEVYWLTVRSVPAGADVLIDGQVEGTTPFVRRIFDPTRNYSITVRRAGFEPHERTLSATDQWTKRGSVRTLTVLAKLNPAVGGPAETQPAPVEPRSQEPSTPPSAEPPPVAPPPVETDRKTNPFAEPGAPGSQPP